MYIFLFDVLKEKFFERQVVFMKNLFMKFTKDRNFFDFLVVGIVVLSFLSAFVYSLRPVDDVDGVVVITPFHLIAEDYEANGIKAQKDWLGKEICIEYKISSLELGGTNIRVWGSRGKRNRSGEYSFFVTAYNFNKFKKPNQIAALKDGQEVKIRGTITRIEVKKKADGIDLEVYLENSAIVK